MIRLVCSVSSLSAFSFFLSSCGLLTRSSKRACSLRRSSSVSGLSLIATSIPAAISLVSTISLVCVPCPVSSRSRNMNLVVLLELISFSTVCRTSSAGATDTVCAVRGIRHTTATKIPASNTRRIVPIALIPSLDGLSAIAVVWRPPGSRYHRASILTPRLSASESDRHLKITIRAPYRFLFQRGQKSAILTRQRTISPLKILPHDPARIFDAENLGKIRPRIVHPCELTIVQNKPVVTAIRPVIGSGDQPGAADCADIGVSTSRNLDRRIDSVCITETRESKGSYNLTGLIYPLGLRVLASRNRNHRVSAIFAEYPDRLNLILWHVYSDNCASVIDVSQHCESRCAV